MNSLYQIYIAPSPGIERKDIEEKMDLAIDHFRCSSRCWIVYTASNARRWYIRLKPLVESGGQLFICKLDISDRQGWMSKRFWDWLQDKQKRIEEQTAE